MSSHGCREPVSFVAVLRGLAWSGVWRLAFVLVLVLVLVRACTVRVRMLSITTTLRKIRHVEIKRLANNLQSNE